MSTLHTPGPWRVRRRVIGAGVPIIDIETNDRRIALVDGGNAANARLIAAAPELLEALTEALRFATDDEGDVWHTPTIEKARAAIAKATQGEKS